MNETKEIIFVSLACYGVAAVALLLFLVSFAMDRRKLRIGIYLFTAIVFIFFGLLGTLASISPAAAVLVLLGVTVLIGVLILALSVFLIGNGMTMLRREGRRPANLLSLAAGVFLILLIVFDLATANIEWAPIRVFRATLTLLVTYFALLFACYLLYAIIYGRIRPRAAVDFVVVLGAGLLGGTRVSPLLASRLDRGRAAFHAAVRKGRDTMIVTSGGQGPGEKRPEAHAMADYLVEKGVPRDRILLEDRSRTTEENLAFSRDIMAARLPSYRSTIVTNNYHVLRAALLAKKARMRAQVLGSPTAMYFWPSATIREFVAIVRDHWIINGLVCVLIVLTEVSSGVH